MNEQNIPDDVLKRIEESAQRFVDRLRATDLSPKALALFAYEEGKKSEYLYHRSQYGHPLRTPYTGTGKEEVIQPQERSVAYTRAVYDQQIPRLEALGIDVNDQFFEDAINAALTMLESYRHSSSGPVWVKGAERLPEYEKEVIVRNIFSGMVDKTTNVGHKENWGRTGWAYSRTEWLDESGQSNAEKEIIEKFERWIAKAGYTRWSDGKLRWDHDKTYSSVDFELLYIKYSEFRQSAKAK